MDRDPFAKVWLAILIAAGAIVLLGLAGLPTEWAATVLGSILPGLVVGGVVTALVAAIMEQLPPALATGTLAFALTVILRAFFFLNAHGH